MSGTHNSEDQPPELPFFTGQKPVAGRAANNKTSGTYSSGHCETSVEDKCQNIDPEIKVEFRS